MALLHEGWLIFIASCCVLGFALWTGMDAMTVKLLFLWTFIAFGFVTLILHAFGSSVAKMLSKLRTVFGLSAEKKVNPVYSEEELIRRKLRAMTKKQALQDSKSQNFQENVLQPRKESEIERKTAEFYRFGKLWRGPGYKLKGSPEDSNADLDNHNCSDDASSDQDEFPEATVSTEGLRQRKLDQHKQTTMDQFYQPVRTTESLPTEPPMGCPGVITVALRCPDGMAKKRRFTLESKIQDLVTFATSLGFPPSRYAILQTFPRQSLSSVTQTFEEAGLTHDVALVVEEL